MAIPHERLTLRIDAITVTLLFLLAPAACVRRDGRNSDCRWPAESAVQAADAKHLSADAEFAEDLAIRYADKHYGHTQEYEAGRDHCLGTLFEQVGKAHGVSASDVSNSLGRNRGRIDIAVNLPFILLYCFGAAAVARTVWRRYPPTENGWIPGAMMTLFLSLVVACGGTMIGEVLSGIAESIRIGNDHMSYRHFRHWWVRHWAGLFAGALVVFWICGAFVAYRLKSSEPVDAVLPKG